jgi:hypothetical protein
MRLILQPRGFALAKTRNDTHLAARTLVTTELEQHGYHVSAYDSSAHLRVEHPHTGQQFWVHVQGNLNRASWWAREIEFPKDAIYCILVVINESRFFVLTRDEFNAEVQEYRRTHSTPHAEGFNWGQCLRFEDKWQKLPGWNADST